MIGRNRTFTTMADDVAQKLDELRDWEQAVQDARAELGRAEAARDNARIELEKARDELFEAHPELRPATHVHPIGGERVDAGGFEHVEVDDENDVPGPLEFTERP